MKKITKRFLAILLIFCMAMGMMSTTALADEAAPLPALGRLAQLASKTIQLTDRDQNEYEITLSVPGAESSLYNEIIIMMDNSGSQGHNFTSLMNTVNAIGESVLNSAGNMKLTLMSFGYAGYTVIEKASTVEELQAITSALKVDDFYDGVGATNCEAGITHIQEYINNSPNLEKAYVFYTTDGEANVSDELLLWDNWENTPVMREKKSGGYFKWNETKTDLVDNLDTRYTVTELIRMAMDYEFGNMLNGRKVASTTEALFPELSEMREAIAAGTAPDNDTLYMELMALLAEVVTDEAGNPLMTTEDGQPVELTRGRQWMDQVWAEAYAMGGLTVGQPCKASALERAFTAYDKANSDNYTWLNMFLEQTYGYKALFEDIHTDYRCASYFKGSPYTDKIYYRYTKGQRAATEAIALSNYEKVETLYLIGMGSSYSGSMGTSWMNASAENKANNTAKVYAEGPKIKFELGGDMAGIMSMLQNYAQQIAITPFNDVAVSDYMSKWVTLQSETIRIYDGNEVICAFNPETGNYEWAEGVVPPTARTPITVTKIDPADYAAGGPEVEGNVSGDIYRIDWNIKDGALLTSDNYSMRYKVNVDTVEYDFEFSEYPNGLENPGDEPFVANGTTAVNYINEEGDPQSEEIRVPVVDAPDPDPKRDIPVTKIWADNNNQENIRPESITLRLYEDGTATGDVLVLNEENNWTGAFEVSEASDAVYTISEDMVLFYVATITGDDDAGFVVTNSAESEVLGDTMSPRAGDFGGTAAWGMMFLLAGIAAVSLNGKVKREEN